MKKADFFQLLQSILDKLPHSDMLQALQYLDQLVDENLSSAPTTSAPKKTTTLASAPSAQLPTLVELEQVESDLLPAYIKSSFAWGHKEHLKALADQLGVSYKAKMTKTDLLEQIVTHLRIRRMPTTLHAYATQTDH